MGRTPWLGFLPNACPARRRPRSTTRRSPSPRRSPLGRDFPEGIRALNPWTAQLERRSPTRRVSKCATSSRVGDRRSSSWAGWHDRRLASKPAAGLVKVGFAYDLGDKTCSFSPREKVRMRGKAASNCQATCSCSSAQSHGLNHDKCRGAKTVMERPFRLNWGGFYRRFQ
jgi:hypothetical protein